MENVEKIVDFNMYCSTCKHKDLPDYKEPCNECLACPTNYHSHKPINYEEKIDKDDKIKK